MLPGQAHEQRLPSRQERHVQRAPVAHAKRLDVAIERRVERNAFVRASKQSHGRARAVRRQLEHRDFTRELAHPVVGARGFVVRAKSGLPDVLGVRHGLGQARRQPVSIGRVQRGQVLEDERRRPAVANQVVGREYDEMHVGAFAQDVHPGHGPGRQIEGPPRLVLQQLRHGPFLSIGWKRRNVHLGDGDDRLARHRLLVASGGKPGAQRLVPLDQACDGRPHRFNRQAAAEPQRNAHVVGRRGLRPHLGGRPHFLLRRRQRQHDLLALAGERVEVDGREPRPRRLRSIGAHARLTSRYRPGLSGSGVNQPSRPSG